jgi:hypothetical protein
MPFAQSIAWAGSVRYRLNQFQFINRFLAFQLGKRVIIIFLTIHRINACVASVSFQDFAPEPVPL